MAKILILGVTGMLGSMVYKYISKTNNHTVHKTIRKKNEGGDEHYFSVENFLHNVNDFSYVLDFDYIINCIGLIKPYCKDNDPEGVYNAIKVNALFPHGLARFCKNSNVKIIQIATDCVYSGIKGNYDEDSPPDPIDVYGKTKSLGEVFEGNFLNIRCSIIGPELKNKKSLLEWFLSQKDNAQIQGYSNHKWNGVTTLQFARLCLKIIDNNNFTEFVKNSYLYHFVPNNPISKYELLKLFQEVFKKDITIASVKNVDLIDRTLTTKYPSFTNFFGHENLHEALVKVYNFMNANKYHEKV